MIAYRCKCPAVGKCWHTVEAESAEEAETIFRASMDPPIPATLCVLIDDPTFEPTPDPPFELPPGVSADFWNRYGEPGQ